MSKILIWVIISGALAAVIGGLVYYSFFVEKSLSLVSPQGGEVLEANNTYRITWKAKKISKIGITLLKEGSKETEWIAKDVSAGAGKYDWNIFVWQTPGQDYKIAIFEYPWKEGNMIVYSKDDFTILGPIFASCDSLSLENEWPFVPSDYPNLKEVFITENSWTGNLEGLAGADKKCQDEAQSLGLEGNWKAFLGDDQNAAVDRLNLDGIFVEAAASGTVAGGKTCHRLLGNNFDEFFNKLSDSLVLNQKRFGLEFLADLPNVWLGRTATTSKKECLTISSAYSPVDIARQYSFTTTCQNWTSGDELVAGYPPAQGQQTEFPICYTPQGKKTNAAAVGGLSIGLTGKTGETQIFSTVIGKSCSLPQKLLCIQQ
jgi:hypothetical protein